MATSLPLFSLISDDIVDGGHAFETITIRWPADTKIPTVRDQWQRLPDGRIEATYTRVELEICFKVFDLTNPKAR
jgi:hypothetical protein